jgi:hypothetical protein
MAKLTDEQINAIRGAWCKDTSADPGKWSYYNPAWGQCAVTALVVQDILGGELRRLELPAGGGHYYNVIGDDSISGGQGLEFLADLIDLTAEQFAFDLDYSGGCVRDRGYVLKFPETNERYKLLKARAHKAYR